MKDQQKIKHIYSTLTIVIFSQWQLFDKQYNLNYLNGLEWLVDGNLNLSIFLKRFYKLHKKCHV